MSASPKPHLIAKRCTKCGESKATSEFNRDRSHGDGLTCWCKGCVNAASKRHRQSRTPEQKKAHNAYCAARRAANPEHYRSLSKRNRARDLPRALWWSARTRARMVGVRFDLERSDIVIPQVCPVLGIPLERGDGKRAGSPTIDRIVPSRGYVRGNIAVISFRANRLKNNATLEELEAITAWLRKVST